MKNCKRFTLLILSIFFTTNTFAILGSPQNNGAIDLQERPPTLIEMLQNGESYSIEITSVGCFHGTRQTVTVTKKDEILTAHFQENSKILTDKDVDVFIRFEEELRTLGLGACTTVDTYVLSYGAQKFRTSDGSCSWNGGKKLLESLGLI